MIRDWFSRRSSLIFDRHTIPLLVMGVLFLFFIIAQIGQAEGGLIIVDVDGNGDFTSIQQAIDNSSDGEVIRIRPGTYNENLRIDVGVTILGEGPEDVLLHGYGNNNVVTVYTIGVQILGLQIAHSDERRIGILSMANNTFLDNLSFSNLDVGIQFEGAVGGVIENCVFSQLDDFGILTRGSSDVIIRNCTFDRDVGTGISLEASTDHSIIQNLGRYHSVGISIKLDHTAGNIIAENRRTTITLSKSVGDAIRRNVDCSISLDQCSQVEVSENIFYDRSNLVVRDCRGLIILGNEFRLGSIWLTGSEREYWDSHVIDPSNTINERQVHYAKNETGITVPIGVGQVIVANCTDVLITQSNFSYLWIGVLVGFSSNVRISNCEFYENTQSGIELHNSTSCTVSKNTFPEEDWRGKREEGPGIALFNTHHTKISMNTIHDIDKGGVLLFLSNNNTIQGNRMQNINTFFPASGIALDESHNNHLYQNNISREFDFGISVRNSNWNSIEENSIWRLRTSSAPMEIERSHSNTFEGNSIVDSKLGGVEVRYSSKNLFSENILTESRGFDIYESHDNTVLKNQISGDRSSILIQMGNNNSIEKNVIRAFNGSAIVFKRSAENNLILGNNISDYEDRGISLSNAVGLIIAGNTIRSNGEEGIRIRGCRNIIIENNTIEGNLEGIHVHREIYDDRSTNVTIRFNHIEGNSQWGINASANDNASVDARNNWWGDDSGPYHEKENPEGAGDRVSDLVAFDPWMNKDFDAKPEASDDGSMRPDLSIIIAGGLISMSLLGLALSRENLRFLVIVLTILPLYSRLKKDEILEQENRRMIYQLITQDPGINYTDIRSETGLGTSSAVHHLSVLERQGYIVSRKVKGRRVFCVKGLSTYLSSTFQSSLSSPTQQRILDFLSSHGPAPMKEIEQELLLKQTTVSYNMRILTELGRIEKSGSDRNSTFAIREQEWKQMPKPLTD